MQGAWVWSLVEQLRSHKLRGTTKQLKIYFQILKKMKNLSSKPAHLGASDLFPGWILTKHNVFPI